MGRPRICTSLHFHMERIADVSAWTMGDFHYSDH